MGTRVEGVRVVRVVDGDTVRLTLGGTEESVRFACVDTEESLATSGKPVTAAGKAASAFLAGLLAPNGEGVEVTVEFDTDDPLDIALVKHRDNYGRLLCYLHRGDENVNVRLVEDGWSPYFAKYGHSRVYHPEFLAAEAAAQAGALAIWDPETNRGGERRDYDALLPWWGLRAGIVEEYRRVEGEGGVLSVRLDYERLTEAADTGGAATVLCDLQAGVNRWTDGGAVVYAGSVQHKFNLWIPDVEREEAGPLTRLIATRYAGDGRRGYVYASGELSLYRGRPQMVLEEIAQLSDTPPN